MGCPEKKHVEDYQNLFNRVRLSLGSDAKTDQTTPQRIVAFANGAPDLDLPALLFDFGRYLLISSSRPGSQPANLQGIWNPFTRPPWWSNYTVNINTEMNYWPAEPCRLGECHEPLFTMLEEIQEQGRSIAKNNYGCRGWVLHHQTDLFRNAHPRGYHATAHKGSARWAMWPMGGVWFCCHLWEHVLHTGDTTFLRERAWPLMKGAAEFLCDWMVRDDAGHWVTCPSTSPENDFVTEDGTKHAVSIASTMDMGLIRQHFSNCIAACERLDADRVFANELREKLDLLFPWQIGHHGQLQEWYKDWDRPEDKHRHVSHLFALHPGHLITENTPELFAAARRTLDMRGDGGTGWSKCWKINFWARLLEGNRAWTLLRTALSPVPPTTPVSYEDGGGIYPNLFCACPPMQIDGNFGLTAGIVEMLLQSHEINAEGTRVIRLLPAIPDEWREGSFDGLCARGGLVLSAKWEHGKVTEAHATALHDQRIELVMNGARRPVDLSARRPTPLHSTNYN